MPRQHSTSKDGFKLPPATRKGYKPPKAPGVPKCGAKRRQGGKCNMQAGWGTNHFGYGQCKLHGGMMPNNIKSAASAEFRTLLGKPIEINPLDALMWCIKIRAGEIKWLSEKMAELDEKNWIEDTMVGKQFHLYARERQHAMADLARYSQMAISLGIAERAVRVAEMYAETFARYTKGLLDEFWPHLDEEGRAKAPQIVRRQLLLIDGAAEEAKQLPQTAAA